MVEMVFIHGVNTRKVAGDGSYDAGVADRDRRFAEVAFEGAGLSIANPYWGAFGAPAKFSCIPAIGADYVAMPEFPVQAVNRRPRRDPVID